LLSALLRRLFPEIPARRSLGSSRLGRKGGPILRVRKRMTFFGHLVKAAIVAPSSRGRNTSLSTQGPLRPAGSDPDGRSTKGPASPSYAGSPVRPESESCRFPLDARARRGENGPASACQTKLSLVADRTKPSLVADRTNERPESKHGSTIEGRPALRDNGSAAVPGRSLISRTLV
jgi:hypothetical protein